MDSQNGLENMMNRHFDFGDTKDGLFYRTYTGMPPEDEYYIQQGFIPKGSKAKYLGRDGYDHQKGKIEAFGVVPGDILEVELASIGLTSSEYKFKEIPGYHNTVMFEAVNDDD